jgi:hypothetical protein
MTLTSAVINNAIPQDEPVFIYRNLHRKCFSIRKESTKRIVGYDTSNFAINAAQFKVSQAGRRRVLRSGQKNVHAGIRGYFEKLPIGFALPEDVVKITYDPYISSGFHISGNPSGLVLKGASVVYFTQYGLYTRKANVY